MAPPGAGGTFQVRLIGRVAVRATDGWRDDWPRPAARRLVALLALSPTRSVPREVAADRLFGHLPADRGLRNLSKALSLARTVVGPGLLQGDATNVWVAETVQVRTDLARDSEQVHQALARPPSPQDWARLRACLARADQLLSEDLYEDWAQDVRREHAAATREAALALARASGLTADWGRVLAAEPCHVEAWSAMLTAAARRGPGELARAYTECRLVHASELQAPPPRALRQLLEEQQSPPSDADKPDVTIGRTAEVSWIEERLDATARGGDSWVVHGPAGIGKTHLLRRAVSRLEERGILVLSATCIPEDAGGPFTPPHLGATAHTPRPAPRSRGPRAGRLRGPARVAGRAPG